MPLAADDVRERVEALGEVATLPSALARILDLVQDDSSTALDLASEISSDQALAIKVLRAVNSAYYGLSRKIATVSEAVVLLGFQEVERLALAISVMNLFGRDRESTRALHLLWRHSLAVSISAGVLESHYRGRAPDLSGAHVAGLLHDVGKAVIAQLYPRCMHDVVETIQSEGVSAYEAERKVLGGVGHTEIGGWLAERWGLPPHLVASVSHHHHPQDAGAQRPMAAAIRIADSVSRECGAISTSSDEPQPEPLTLSELPGFADAPLGRMREQLGHAGGLISAVAAGALY